MNDLQFAIYIYRQVFAYCGTLSGLLAIVGIGFSQDKVQVVPINWPQANQEILIREIELPIALPKTQGSINLRLRNEDKETFSFSRVEVSCGCIGVDTRSKEVGANSEEDVQVHYDVPSTPGEFDVFADFIDLQQSKRIRILLKGRCEDIVRLSTDTDIVVDGRSDQPVEFTVVSDYENSQLDQMKFAVVDGPLSDLEIVESTEQQVKLRARFVQSDFGDDCEARCLLSVERNEKPLCRLTFHLVATSRAKLTPVLPTFRLTSDKWSCLVVVTRSAGMEKKVVAKLLDTDSKRELDLAVNNRIVGNNKQILTLTISEHELDFDYKELRLQILLGTQAELNVPVSVLK